MNKKEKELFKALCSFKAKEFDYSLLSHATPIVLGQLFFNRMQAVAYGVLKEAGFLNRINREFRNSLKVAYEQNIEKNKCFFENIANVNNILMKCDCRYAMLKGAYLCKLYPDGYRTSNDIDILVHPNDITKIGRALSANGFKQGHVQNGVFSLASRAEVIGSRMTRGETVPFVKEVNCPGMKYLEIDINFSLDYKPGDTVLLEDMLDNVVEKKIGDLKVRTLNDADFFIHLCSHLYKEATTLPWIEMKRDMTLYKYADIYMLLNDMNKKEIDFLFARAKATGMSKICAFAVIQMSKLLNFENRYAVSSAKKILKNDPDFIHTVVSPREQKNYRFSKKSIESRFFSDNRKNLLQEVK